MNRSISLPESTALRIDAAILELGYRPNRTARNLSLGKSQMIGLVTPDIANPFFASLASAAEEQAARRGYSVILCSSQNRLEREISYLGQLSSRQLDGLLFLTSHGRDAALAELIEASEHIVLVDEDVEGTSVPKLLTDNAQGGYLATTHLLNAGHRLIAHIGGPSSLLSARERLAGYQRALSEAGIMAQLSDLSGPYTADFGRAAAAHLLTLEPRPTAVFAASDYIAIGMLNHFKSVGIRVPKDISIVGFDDIPFVRLFDPPLSTIRQPIEELGRLGVDMLLRRIQGGPTQQLTERLPVELVKRGSVAAPKENDHE